MRNERVRIKTNKPKMVTEGKERSFFSVTVSAMVATPFIKVKENATLRVTVIEMQCSSVTAYCYKKKKFFMICLSLAGQKIVLYEDLRILFSRVARILRDKNLLFSGKEQILIQRSLIRDHVQVPVEVQLPNTYSLFLQRSIYYNSFVDF